MRRCPTEGLRDRECRDVKVGFIFIASLAVDKLCHSLVHDSCQDHIGQVFPAVEFLAFGLPPAQPGVLLSSPLFVVVN